MYLILMVLNALHGLIDFYAVSYNELNVDGLFGLRIIEGQLNKLWQIHKGTSSWPVEVIDDVKWLSEQADLIADKAVPIIEKLDPPYFEQFEHTSTHPFTPFFELRLTDPTLFWTQDIRKLKIEMTESESDECLAELIKAATAAGHNIHANKGKCGVSKDCLKRMLGTKGTIRYTIQHQLLYVILAEMLNCMKPLELYARKTLGYPHAIKDWITEFCTNSLYQLESSVKDLDYECIRDNIGSVNLCSRQPPDMFPDLFMEQQFICGQLGFAEFTQRDWLELILSLQDPKGCYEMPPEDPGSDHRAEGDEMHGGLKDQLQKPDTRQQKKPRLLRKLLMERPVHGHCGSHSSAVAAGALVIYLRFLLEDLLKSDDTRINRWDLRLQAPRNLTIHNQGAFLPTELSKLLDEELNHGRQFAIAHLPDGGVGHNGHGHPDPGRAFWALIALINFTALYILFRCLAKRALGLRLRWIWRSFLGIFRRQDRAYSGIEKRGYFP